jgi:hypothetical protein
MRIRYLGDSYDIVKQSLLRWLKGFGEWSVHPMFTEPWAQSDVSVFELLLDAKVISTEILRVDTDRSAYLACCSSCGHLFLDPDTGLRMRTSGGADAPKFLFAAELEKLAKQRPDRLTLVFDQSVQRGSERLHLTAKLHELRERGVFGWAYVSHACFIIAGRDPDLLAHARTQVLAQSHLPYSRILSLPFPD